ncbi:hypothetical protein MIR68_005751 [Amoeboaphelidium protococcarum]|nr:hypothetical protein MIR68_005751 [Amoeboaphelidium protococcarum]
MAQLSTQFPLGYSSCQRALGFTESIPYLILCEEVSTNSSVIVPMYRNGSTLPSQKLNLGNGVSQVLDMALDSNRNIYITGVFNEDVFLLKYNQNLTVAWYRVFQSVWYDSPSSIFLANSDALVGVTGITYGAMGANVNKGQVDAFCMTYLAGNGTFKWAILAGGTQNDKASVGIDFSGVGIAFAGYQQTVNLSQTAFVQAVRYSDGALLWSNGLNNTFSEYHALLAKDNMLYVSGKVHGNVNGLDTFSDTQIYIGRYSSSGVMDTAYNVLYGSNSQVEIVYGGVYDQKNDLWVSVGEWYLSALNYYSFSTLSGRNQTVYSTTLAIGLKRVAIGLQRELLFVSCNTSCSLILDNTTLPSFDALLPVVVTSVSSPVVSSTLSPEQSSVGSAVESSSYGQTTQVSSLMSSSLTFDSTPLVDWTTSQSATTTMGFVSSPTTFAIASSSTQSSISSGGTSSNDYSSSQLFGHASSQPIFLLQSGQQASASWITFAINGQIASSVSTQSENLGQTSLINNGSNSQGIALLDTAVLIPIIVGVSIAFIVMAVCAFLWIRRLRSKMRKIQTKLKSTLVTSTVQEVSSYQNASVNDTIGMASTYGATMINTSMEISIPAHLQAQFGVDYRNMQKLAAGGAGEIYLCQLLSNQVQARNQKQSLAVCKIINEEMVESNQKYNMAAFYQEVSLLFKFHGDPLFAQLIAFSDDPYSMVLTYYPFGSLQDYIYGKNVESIKYLYTKRQALQLLKYTAVALYKLHAIQVAHCDIKPANILLQVGADGLLWPALADFGISQMLNPEGLQVKAFKVSSLRGLSMSYASPESILCYRNLLPSSQVSWTASDVYSLSIVMLGMMTRSLIWNSGTVQLNRSPQAITKQLFES